MCDKIGIVLNLHNIMYIHILRNTATYKVAFPTDSKIVCLRLYSQNTVQIWRNCFSNCFRIAVRKWSYILIKAWFKRQRRLPHPPSRLPEAKFADSQVTLRTYFI